MVKKNISDLIIELHQLARDQADHESKMAIIKIADDLAKVGNRQLDNILAGAEQQGDDDKNYTLSSQEKYDEFVKKRNYKFEGDCV